MDRPKDAYEAIDMIEDRVREIQILCDEFGLDPVQWLAEYCEELDAVPQRGVV